MDFQKYVYNIKSHISKVYSHEIMKNFMSSYLVIGFCLFYNQFCLTLMLWIASDNLLWVKNDKEKKYLMNIKQIVHNYV